jgi:superfamily II DNA or RNA helicase/SOS-response transcriptional repressor LexA
VICTLCVPMPDHVIAENDHACAVADGDPTAPRWIWIAPRRHVARIADLPDDERTALMDLAVRLQDSTSPTGTWSLHLDEGLAAPHVHARLLPPEVALPERLTDGASGGPLYRALSPLFPRAVSIDILAAFVQDSGLALLEPAVQDAVRRGARVRLLTGDYLDITQVAALQRLSDWAAAVQAEGEADDAELHVRGGLDARVIETAAIQGRAFHPKAWMLEGPGLAVAFVGSSNVSRSALQSGIEWNLRVDGAHDPVAWSRVRASFSALWDRARALDADWIAAYAARARDRALPLPPGEVDRGELPRLPDPTPLQQEALRALADSRAQGRTRALLVLATGLGKTVVAAHDLRELTGDRPPSVLWVAHRRELLEQAAATLRLAFPGARFAWWLGARRPEGAHDVLFASIQGLSRVGNLSAFDRDRFDAVVIDEVHHADAPSYRRLLDHFQPRFLLGLTATPDRADAGDIQALFDDHIAFQADLGAGIATGQLVPFSYYGLRDPTDYTPIPWRNRRFDTEALTSAVATQARMQALWEAWEAPDKRAKRSLVFCVSVRHATFVRDWLVARGLRVRLCHAAEGSDDRTAALQDLESGDIDAICSVDLFNEGIDCRPVDRVVMLRPTESTVLFLQQLGRGLRRADDKDRLVVLDFVGNHSLFFGRLRVLLQSVHASRSYAQLLDAGRLELPDGCEVAIELAAIDILRRLLPRESSSVLVVRTYRELRAAHGRRPRAGELVRAGHRLRDLERPFGGWFGLVNQEGDLEPAEAAAIALGRDWLQAIEGSARSEAAELLALRLLLEGDRPAEGLPASAILADVRAALGRSPTLREDGVRDDLEHRGLRLRLRGDRLVLPLADDPVLLTLGRELVDAALAGLRQPAPPVEAPVRARVVRHKGSLALDIAHPDCLPTAPVDVQVSDAEGAPSTRWRVHFDERPVVRAAPLGVPQNQLQNLLLRWFPASVGGPGHDAWVVFDPSPDALWLRPVHEGARAPPVLVELPAFPDLQAAAGWSSRPIADAAPDRVALPGPHRADHFAVRVSGSSMDGGLQPLRDGDWAICAWARGQGLGAAEGEVALVALGDPDQGRTHHLKRIITRADRHLLRSDNPAESEQDGSGAELVARLVRAVRPESLAPEPGTDIDDIRAAFGLSAAPEAPASRVDGHLFLLADGRGVLEAPDRWPLRSLTRAPGETAYVLARASGGDRWTFLGVGRWDVAEGAWAFPAPPALRWHELADAVTWSRTLPMEWRVRAQAFARMLGETKIGAEFAREAGMARVVRITRDLGVFLEGVDGSLSPRPISATDIGWVIWAADEAARGGPPLSLETVNRLRYLKGTPKGKTRYIDTKLAMALWRAFGHAGEP